MSKYIGRRHIPMSDSEFDKMHVRKIAYMRGWMDAAQKLRANPPNEHHHEYSSGYDDGQEMRRQASYKSGVVAVRMLKHERGEKLEASHGRNGSTDSKALTSNRSQEKSRYVEAGRIVVGRAV